MDNTEDIYKNTSLELARLKEENAKLKQELAGYNSINAADLISGFGNESIIVINNGVCESANTNFLRQFNFDKSELNSLNYCDLFGSKEDLDEVQSLIKGKTEGCVHATIQYNRVFIYACVSIKFAECSSANGCVMVINDISECKEKEQQIQFEHDELDSIFNTSMIGIVYIDMDRVIRRANSRAEQILRYKNIVGMSMTSFHLNEEKFNEFTKYYKTVLEEGGTVDIEYPFKRKNGEHVWLHLIGKAIKKPGMSDELAGTIWTFDDISERREAQRKLESANIELNAYFENSMMGILIVTPSKNGSKIISRVNNRLVELLGFDNKEELIGKCVDQFHVSKEKADEFSRNIVAEFMTGGVSFYEFQFKKKDGCPVWVAGSAQTIDTSIPPDLSMGAIFMLDDTTEKREDREKLESANAELETYFNNSTVGVLVGDETNMICKANAKLANILGYESAHEVVGMYPSDFFYNLDEIEGFFEFVVNVLSEHTEFTRELQVKDRYGKLVWVCASGKAIDKTIPPDFSKGVVWVIEDITARKVAEARLVELATVDELTGINNRRHFLSLCEKEVLIAKRKKHDVALFMIDLDYFKAVNDTYGHAVGDKTLRYFADVCGRSLRPSDIFGRVGGEEFAVLLPDTPKDQVLNIAERLRIEVMGSFEDTSHDIPQMTISIGVCFLIADEELDEALKRADSALYQAKDSGRNKVVVMK